MRKILALLGILLSAPAFAQSIQAPAGQILGNSTATQRPAQASTVTAILDRAMGSTSGSIMVRGASAWAVSSTINIGAGLYGGSAAFTNNFNVYPVNANNGIMLGYGAGSGLGGGISLFRKNASGPIINQNELGFLQAFGDDGTGFAPFSGAPAAIIFYGTETWGASTHGTGLLFQAVKTGDSAASSELAIVNGITALAPSTVTGPTTGLGTGTINALSGLYDTNNRVLSASNTLLTLNQNAATNLQVQNSTNNTASSASFQVTSDVASVQVGSAATLYSTAIFAGRSFVYANSVLVVGSSGANGTVIAVNAAEVARFNGTTAGQLTLGLAGTTVGKLALANATSGSVVFTTPVGALGTSVATAPVGAYNIVGDSLTQTLSAKTFVAPALGTIASGNLAAGTGYLVSSLSDVAWPTYACALASEAGGGLGTGNTLTCTWKSIGKEACVTGTIAMGASGVGTATQVSVSLPSTATRNAIMAGKNTTSGLGVAGDIGAVSFTKALLNTTSTGAIGVANSQTTVFTGCYEQN